MSNFFKDPLRSHSNCENKKNTCQLFVLNIPVWSIKMAEDTMKFAKFYRQSLLSNT